MNFMENETAQKLRGGYYTPPDLASFLARWVVDANPRTILEPSCGEGIFFEALAKSGASKGIRVEGLELDAAEALRARSRARQVGLRKASVEPGDFLQWAIEQLDERGKRFDAVLGNPPFVRYQYLPEPFQARAETVFRLLGQKFTKHTNAWVPFVLASMAMLRPGGRLAMVVPAEIIHVTHAQSLRSYLGRECSRLVIVDPEELWFTGTLQGAVLILAQKRRGKRDKSQGVGIYPVRNREFLRLDPEAVFKAPQAINGKTVEGKWTRALLDAESRDMLDELCAHRQVHRFDDVAEVDVGIVTGANNYFLASDEIVERYGLRQWAHPMFGRSNHCPGIVYDKGQHEENAREGKPINFVWFRNSAVLRDARARAYIRLGEDQRLHTRYKCRVRSPWYSVPSVYATEVGMLKRCHDTPRLILNRLGAYTTDTAYRIRTDIAPEKLVGCFITPLTALSAELEGRHYGGGVLELIPSEIERLTVALPDRASVDVDALDRDVRSMSVEGVLDRQGKRVLGALGLSKAQRTVLLAGWRKLRNRRHRTGGDAAMEAV